ncbi:MATE family efflux transporter [Candidatus Phytoplasma fraxini]|uniref:Na+-driven multidrug efflux pump (MATE) n=1 Tax=Ash yellows phytoplasma TaxID=35780 RepID=A0ABZ2U8H5_ASHYP
MLINSSDNSRKKNILESDSNKEISIWKNLIILAFPIALYLLFQNVSSSIDFYIIKKPTSVSNTNVEAAVTYMKQIKKVLQSIAISLGGAGVVLVAREYKQKNNEQSKQYATLIFIMSVLSSLSIFLIFYVGALLPSPLGDIFLSRAYHLDGGWEYYIISLLTFVFITINCVFIGLERTKNKKRIVLFLNILNITLRIILAFLMKYIQKDNVTIIHLAWADFFSNFAISLFAFYFMFNSKNDFQIQFRKLIFPKKVVKNILKLSFILIIGKATYEIGKKFINDMATDYYGKDLISITGLVAAVNGIFYSISQSFEDAESVMVSRQAKINKNTNTLKIFKNAFIITLIIGIIGVFSNHFFGEFFLKILKPSDQITPDSLKNFKTVLFFEQMSLFTSVWASIIMIYIVSYTKNASIVLWLNMLRIVARMSCLWFCHKYKYIQISDYTEFGISTSLSNIIVLAVTVILFIRFIKAQKIIERNMNL